MITYNKTNIKKILLTGGGTGGSVSPLLAIFDELQVGFLWIGTRKGLERKMVENKNIEFKAVLSGKLRRYFSLRNFIDPLLIIIGFVQSLIIISKWKPNLVISAGSFASVPVVWAAWVLRVPVLIHQQDIGPGLANKLMAPFASVITVTFEKSLEDYSKKAVWTGNMVRKELRITNYELRINEIKNKFGLKDKLPVVLVIGGGGGAEAINKLVGESLDELIKFCQIIHITGKNKSKIKNLPANRLEPQGDWQAGQKSKIINYKSYEFLNLERLAEAYAISGIVVSRCGLGVLTELSYLGKPSILIPMPNSHQEENANVFKEKKAAIALDQNKISPQEFSRNIKKLINDKKLRDSLSGNIKNVIKSGANEKIVKIIRGLLFSNN